VHGNEGREISNKEIVAKRYYGKRNKTGEK
jgi:hypothetical protein